MIFQKEIAAEKIRKDQLKINIDTLTQDCYLSAKATPIDFYEIDESTRRPGCCGNDITYPWSYGRHLVDLAGRRANRK